MFTGFMKNDMIEGAGTLVCTNGASYRGPFRQSLFDGPNAELVYPNGEKYVGPFKAGLRHGPNGTMTYADGSVYHGDWRSDQVRAWAFCALASPPSDMHTPTPPRQAHWPDLQVPRRVRV